MKKKNLKFLNKKQKEELTKQKWEMLPTETGLLWVGGNWDDKQNLLGLMGEAFPELELDGDKSYNFLVCAYADD